MTRSVLGASYRILRDDLWRFLLLTGVAVVPLNAAQSFAPGRWRDLPFYLAVIGYPLAQAAVADAVRERQTRPEVSIRSYLRIAPRFMALAFASIAGYVGIFVGLFLLIVPGLLAIARWSVFVPVIVNEQELKIGIGPLARSNHLVRGNTWTGFSIFLLPLLPMIVISLPNLALHSLALAWLAIALSPLVASYGGIAAAVFYERLTHDPLLQPERPTLPIPGTEEPPPSAAEAARRRLWKP